ncbi:DapH/DapD/GlmU-related protein [Aquabacterium sp.]|uniref:acyltransferase n=1 Tax=Aquabacterium sp. TaxID=1872578 RepID=UPI0035ADC8B3
MISARTLKIYLVSIKRRLPPWTRAAWLKIHNHLSVAFEHKHIGRQSYIAPGVHVTRWRKVQIGNNSVICDGTFININDLSTEAHGIQIGDNVWVGRHNFFSPGPALRLGDYVLTAPDCRFLGANHNINDPFQPYIATGTTGRDITIGTNVWLGAGVTVMGGVTIGHGSIVGAGSIVTKPIPPFCIATGIPAKVVKVFDAKSHKWVPIDKPHEPLTISEADYVQHLNSKTPHISMPWQVASKRMGDGYRYNQVHH